MTTVYWDDRHIIKEIGQELENIILYDGVDLGASYLKHVLASPYSKSPIFLRAISQLKSVRKLLSKVSPEQAREIKKLLEGGRDG